MWQFDKTGILQGNRNMEIPRMTPNTQKFIVNIKVIKSASKSEFIILYILLV